MNTSSKKYDFVFSVHRGEGGIPSVHVGERNIRISYFRKPAFAANEQVWWGANTEAARMLAFSLLSEMFDVDDPHFGHVSSLIPRSHDYIEAVVMNLLVPETRDEFQIAASDIIKLAPEHIAANLSQ